MNARKHDTPSVSMTQRGLFEVTASCIQADRDISELSHWNTDPFAAFHAWATSKNANNGFGFSDSSVKTYSAMWGKFVKFKPNNPVLASCADIESFIESLTGRVRNEVRDITGRPSALPIQRRYLAMLSKLFAHFVKIGLRKENVAETLLHELDRKNRSVPRSLPTALSEDEEGDLVKAIENWTCVSWRDYRDKALLATLIGAGLKVSEVRILEWGDITTGTNVNEVHVRIGAQERFAPLNDFSANEISHWKGLYPARLLSNFIFPGDNGDVLSASAIYRIVAEAIKIAGLSPMHTGPSILRHTFAIRQVRAGINIDNVRLWLGHKQQSSTEIYRSMVVNPSGTKVH